MRLAPVLTLGIALALSTPCQADLFFSRQTSTTAGEVVRYDTATQSVVRTYSVAIGDMDGLALDPVSGNLFIGSSNSQALFRLDLQSGAASTVPVPVSPLGPSDVVFGPSGHLFLANQLSLVPGSVIRYDVAAEALIGVFTVQDLLAAPRGLAFGPNGDLFISSGGLFDSRIFRINPDTGELLQTYSSGLAVPGGLAFDASGILYATNSSSQNIVRIDVATGATTVFSSGVRGQGLAFGPDGNLYFGSITQEVLVLNPNTGAIVGRIPVGSGGPDYLTFGDVPQAVVPEPSSLGILSTGCLALVLARQWRGRRAPVSVAGVGWK